MTIDADIYEVDEESEAREESEAKERKALDAHDKDAHDKEMHLAGLWDDFFITRDPSLLASFIREGGEINDQKTRSLIADLLETVTNRHSRAKSQWHADFYMAIKEVMWGNPTISRNEAFRIFTGKAKAAPDELKTEQSNYAIGAELVGDGKVPKV